MVEQPKRKTALARKMRKALTEPEFLLWERLRVRSDGLVSRRQHLIGPYIADFCCFRARLVVEVDGATHGEDEAVQRDAVRDSWIGRQGLAVYRFSAAEVYRDADAAADGVWLMAYERAEKVRK